jgi:hypothetical protein
MSIRFVDINGIVEEVFRRCEVFAISWRNANITYY